jgi:hypothetical protein
MGRKPLDDSMQKTLSVRVTEKVVAFLENTRLSLERTGEKASTSEVARQVLDSMVERQLPLGFSMDLEESLRSVQRAIHDGLPLTQHDYALLAETAHSAYQRTAQDYVRADLLLNNLNAFAAYIQLRNERMPKSNFAAADRYYFGNLGANAQKEENLIAAVQRAKELVHELGQPYRTTGEFMARNLTILRDDIGLSNEAVDETLRPHAQDLLKVALHAYYLMNDKAIDSIEARVDIESQLRIRGTLAEENDAFKIFFLGGTNDLNAILTPQDSSWYLELDAYPKIVDFIQLVQLEKTAESQFFRLQTSAPSFLSSEEFSRISFKHPHLGVGINLSAVQMTKMREMLELIVENSEYSRLTNILSLRYGNV